MTDYLIVGCGIAGLSFAELAIRNSKSISVMDNFSTNSSRIAGGLYNPVVLKRFSEVWKAKEQMDFSLPFINSLEERLSIKADFPIPIYRKFASIEEQNNWFIAADKINLSEFLSTQIIAKEYKSITSKYGFGEVLRTGYVDINVLLNNYIEELKSKQIFVNQIFDYDSLIFHDDYIQYDGNAYKNIVFSEGFGLKNNPFFNYLPLDGTKGELLIIKAENLDLDVVIKSNIFILPIGNSLFKVGATYNWEDKTDIPTEEGKSELLEALNELIDCKFEIIDHFAGVRPTVKDRRPLVGTHHIYKNIHVLNGLGTRGVMLGPWLAKSLFDYLENEIVLDKNISIERFYKKMGLNG